MFNLQETMVSDMRLCHPFHRTRTHYHWTRKHRRRWHRPPPSSHCSSPPPLRLSPKFIRLQLPSRKWLLSSLYIHRPCHPSKQPPIGYHTFPSNNFLKTCKSMINSNILINYSFLTLLIYIIYILKNNVQIALENSFNSKFILIIAVNTSTLPRVLKFSPPRMKFLKFPIPLFPFTQFTDRD